LQAILFILSILSILSKKHPLIRVQLRGVLMASPISVKQSRKIACKHERYLCETTASNPSHFQPQRTQRTQSSERSDICQTIPAKVFVFFAFFVVENKTVSFDCGCAAPQGLRLNLSISKALPWTGMVLPFRSVKNTSHYFYRAHKRIGRKISLARRALSLRSMEAARAPAGQNKTARVACFLTTNTTTPTIRNHANNIIHFA